MTLTEFLRARLDEDERHARKLAETDRRPVLSLATTINHPERLLLEVEAKRAIMADFETLNADYRKTYDRMTEARRFQALVAIGHLATVYADHDDYDEGWRP